MKFETGDAVIKQGSSMVWRVYGVAENGKVWIENFSNRSVSRPEDLSKIGTYHRRWWLPVTWKLVPLGKSPSRFGSFLPWALSILIVLAQYVITAHHGLVSQWFSK